MLKDESPYKTAREREAGLPEQARGGLRAPRKAGDKLMLTRSRKKPFLIRALYCRSAPAFFWIFFIFVWCRRIPSAYTLGIPKNDFWRLLASTAAPECERGAHSIRRQRQNVRGARILYDGSASVQEGRAFYTTAAPECGSGAHPLGWQRQNASTTCYKALLYYDLLRCTIMGHYRIL